MNRRKFCSGVMSTVFMNSLISDIVLGIPSTAFAATTSGITKNYICFWAGAGLERSWFDGILSPNGASDNLGGGAGVYSAPSANTADPTQWIERLTNSKVNNKYYLPYLWESMLPNSSGGSVAMKDLAANTAIIRGVQTGLTFDAHAQNEKQMQVPFPNESILGHIADNSSDADIPAVVSSGHFTSHKNNAAAKVGPTSNAYDIFKPVIFEKAGVGNAGGKPYTSSPSALMGLEKMDNVVSSFINSLTPQMSARKKKTYQVMMDNRKKAVALIKNGFGSIREDYEVALEKYLELITMVLNPTQARYLDTFDNKDFKGTGLNFQFWEDTPGNYGGLSVLDGFKTAKMNNMAHAFAKAEVYLKYNVTNCMHLQVMSLDTISDQFTRDPGNPTQTKGFSFDSHYVGQVIRGVGLSRLFQAFSACMLHFKGQVGTQVWNSTLVNLRSEFNRGIAMDRGSDHNIRSCVETYFSGAIKDGPIIAGDVEYSNNSKCVGEGAAISELKDAKIDSKHIYSTVGTLMGYTPSRNHPTILKAEGGKIVSSLAPPQNKLKAG